jgi:hypothetical protein
MCDSSVEMMSSTASCRGSFWAEDVARKMRVVAPMWPAWPAFDASERVRAIALLKVEDLERDHAARETLARVCCASAARRWEELRIEVATGMRTL